MDTKTLISQAHARFEHNSAKQHLKEKYQAKLIVANQGGLWKVTPEVIGFLSSSIDIELVLLDSYENPVKVNRTELLECLSNLYKNVMNDWYEEYQTIRKLR